MRYLLSILLILFSFNAYALTAATKAAVTASNSACTPQTITWNTQPSAMTYGDSPQALTQATSSSGLPITYSTDTTTYCTVSGSVGSQVLNAVNATGNCVVHANQGGNGTYCAASQVNSGNVAITGAHTEAEETCSGNCITSVSWYSGTDAQNASGGSTHVFSNKTDTYNYLTRDTGGHGYHGESDSMKFVSDSNSATAYVSIVIANATCTASALPFACCTGSGTGTCAAVDQVSDRFFVTVGALYNMGSDGYYLGLNRIGNSTHSNETYVRIYCKDHLAHTYEFQVCYYDVNTAGQVCTASGAGYAITVGNSYQISTLWKRNTYSDTGAIVKIYDGTGASLLATLTGAGNPHATSDIAIDRVSVGVQTQTSPGQPNTLYFDAYRVEGGASQTIIAPRTD